PTSSAWKEQHLTDRLQQRLQESYTVYFDLVRNLEQVLTTLAEKIGLDNQGLPRWVDPRSRKQHWKRFTTCLNRKEHEAHLAEMSRDNQNLRNLTNDSLELEPIRQIRRNRKKSFKVIRDHAVRLHSALKSCLSCSCSTTHCADLQLEQRDWDQLPSFRVTFPLDSLATETLWHETEIKISLKPDDLDPAPISMPAEPSLVTDRDPKTSNASIPMAELTSSLQRFKSNKHRVKWAVVPGIQSANLPLAHIVHAKGEVLSRESSCSQAPVRDTGSINDLCTLLRCAGMEPGRSCIGRFADEQSYYDVFTVSRYQDHSTPTSNLHDLLHRHQTRMTTTSVEQSAMSGVPGPRLTKKARLQLAATLAATALQLHTTPWLDTFWNGESIRFRQGSIEHPYISTTFPKTEPGPPATDGDKGTFSLIRNRCMFGLGVLLIELSLGRPLECYKNPRQDLRAEDFSAIAQQVGALADEESPGYSDALKACIWCDFRVKDLDMENDSFRRAIYEEVVVPLERDLKFYCHANK
ncbi:MAG: hypothetical protein Q9224_006720, partial [Gallowayella concinna]